MPLARFSGGVVSARASLTGTSDENGRFEREHGTMGSGVATQRQHKGVVASEQPRRAAAQETPMANPRRPGIGIRTLPVKPGDISGAGPAHCFRRGFRLGITSSSDAAQTSNGLQCLSDPRIPPSPADLREHYDR